MGIRLDEKLARLHYRMLVNTEILKGVDLRRDRDLASSVDYRNKPWLFNYKPSVTGYELLIAMSATWSGRYFS